MLVRCISNVGSDLPEAVWSPERGVDGDTEWEITPNEVYAVYAITAVEGHQYFYVREDDSDDSVEFVPAALFVVVDASLPEGWAHTFVADAAEPVNSYTMTAFREWVENPMFLENLTDGEAEAVAAFRRQTKVLADFHAG